MDVCCICFAFQSHKVSSHNQDMIQNSTRQHDSLTSIASPEPRTHNHGHHVLAVQAAFSKHNQLVDDLCAKAGPLSTEVRL